MIHVEHAREHELRERERQVQDKEKKLKQKENRTVKQPKDTKNSDYSYEALLRSDPLNHRSDPSYIPALQKMIEELSWKRDQCERSNVCEEGMGDPYDWLPEVNLKNKIETLRWDRAQCRQNDYCNGRYVGPRGKHY